LKAHFSVNILKKKLIFPFYGTKRLPNDCRILNIYIMSTLSISIVPVKVLADGSHKIRISASHKYVTGESSIKKVKILYFRKQDAVIHAVFASVE